MGLDTSYNNISEVLSIVMSGIRTHNFIGGRD